MSEKSTYDFIINDEDEVMLLLYAAQTKPENARFTLNFAQKSAELKRNADEIVVLQSIPDDVIDSLADADTLLVCEITDAEKDEDCELVYAYEAEIVD